MPRNHRRRERVKRMRLDLSSAIRDPGQSYPFSVKDIALEPIVYLDDPVSFSNVDIEGDLVGTGDAVAMKAVVTADVTSRCALCLEEAHAHLEADVDYRFSRTPADEDEYLIEGYKADLDKPVMDALLLEMPMRFLCRPDCKGLCPVCGRNRNTENCTCVQDAGQNE